VMHLKVLYKSLVLLLLLYLLFYLHALCLVSLFFYDMIDIPLSQQRFVDGPGEVRVFDFLHFFAIFASQSSFILFTCFLHARLVILVHFMVSRISGMSRMSSYREFSSRHVLARRELEASSTFADSYAAVDKTHAETQAVVIYYSMRLTRGSFNAVIDRCRLNR